MNKTIYLNEEEVNVLLDALNKEKEKLTAMLDKQKEIIESMHKSWSGTSGDKAYEALKEHEKKYEVYLNALNVRIKFLDKVKNAYLSLDKKFEEKLEQNSNIEA